MSQPPSGDPDLHQAQPGDHPKKKYRDPAPEPPPVNPDPPVQVKVDRGDG